MSGDVKKPKTKAFLLYRPNAKEGMYDVTSMLKTENKNTSGSWPDVHKSLQQQVALPNYTCTEFTSI